MEPVPTLLEFSFVDLTTAIEQAADLPEERRHWACSVRQVTKWLDRAPELIPARLTATKFAIGQLHHVRTGVTAKTLRNHVSNVRAASRWFGKANAVQPRGVPLSPGWAKLCSRLDKAKRLWVSSFARYCSGRRIEPAEVNDTIFDQYWAYRGSTTARPTDNNTRRHIVRVWNTCAAAMVEGLALQQLIGPPLKVTEPAWDKFPEGLRSDLDTYFAGQAKPHRALNGKRIQPCRPGTIRTRRAEMVAMARMAVRLGVPIESLTSLGALLHSDVVERVIDAYWQKNGKEPKTSTIDLGKKVFRMARETGCLDEAALARLDDIRVALEQHRRGGLTPKNLQLVRQVLTDGIWNDVVVLPNVLLQQAHAIKDHAPVKAALLAQLAVAIAILTFAPVRLQNLVSIELDQNLHKPGGPDTPYWLVFPHYDVKNRVDLTFKLDELLTELIDEYVREFRPTLLRGTNASWLFPGEAGQPKHKLQFSKQITVRIEKAIGLRITVHQFRHAAAAIYLKHRPGDYETVRRLLGHRDLSTTSRYYCGLETVAASEQFGKLVRQQIKLDVDVGADNDAE
jgi:Phage integrase family